MNEDYLANIRPTHRQLQWQRMEMYAFTHFGMNTMTDREWGLGHEDPALFNPVDFDADQWMEALKAAGMTGVILTCKHHDGFCLWPSAYTKHSVASSPWKDGKGDVVREVSDAARRHGLKFGVYLSPWDRTEATYGSGKDYDDYYVNQLVELLTHYGPIFTVWLDGACGEGPNGKKQQADDGEFSRLVRSDEEDLGSRKALADYDGPLAWYPSEVNTSTRPGWFYHENEDAQVRTPEELFDIWASAVGGNATFLLNVPPTPRGLIADADVKALAGLGKLVADLKGRMIADGVTVSVSSTCRRCTARGFEPAALLDTAADSAAWTPTCRDAEPTVTLDFDEPCSLSAVVDVYIDGQLLAHRESVGYQRIIRFDEPVTARQVVIHIPGFRTRVHLASAIAVEA